MYTINHYNGNTLANIADGVLDTSTSLSLAGRNFTGYGLYLNENQIYLLENFASGTGPINPVPGQIWYNTSKDYLSVYSGTAYSVLTNTAMLSSSVSVLESKIISNVDIVNRSIIANVTALNANAASQDAQITNLWTNAAAQSASISNLVSVVGTQSQSIDVLTANAGVQSNAIVLRATIDSPVLTGNPRSTTASSGDRSTTVATTAYVMSQDDVRRVYIDNNMSANIASISGSLTGGLNLKANINSPTFTGVPSAPTANADTRSTQVATLDFVMNQDDVRRIYVDVQIAGNINTLNTAVNNNLALKSPIDSPVFTGTARSITPSSGDNSTKIATTGFVQGEIAAGALWQGSHRFISANAPDPAQGNNGDFWFQYQ